MDFELLDGYLLKGTPAKADVVKRLLAQPSPVPAAQAFYEGMRLLGPRTPDLTLIALRLVLAGQKPDDASVVELRTLIEEAKNGSKQALERYRMRLLGTETL
jgi:hypothetical protein